MTSAAPGTPSPDPGPGPHGPDAGPDVASGAGPWRAPVPWEPADGHTGRAAYLTAPTPASTSTPASSSAAAKRAPARGRARARRAVAEPAVSALEEVAVPSAQQLRDRPGAVLLAAVCACGWVGPTAALPSPPRPARAPQRGAKASRRDRRRQGATASAAGGAGDTGGAGSGSGTGELVERDQAWRTERDQAAAALAEQWRAHLDQQVPSLEVAVAIAERDATIAAANAHVDDVVRRARNRDDPVTWTLIGKAEGITRAGAFNRWGAKP